MRGMPTGITEFGAERAGDDEVPGAVIDHAGRRPSREDGLSPPLTDAFDACFDEVAAWDVREEDEPDEFARRRAGARPPRRSLLHPVRRSYRRLRDTLYRPFVFHRRFALWLLGLAALAGVEFLLFERL